MKLIVSIFISILILTSCKSAEKGSAKTQENTNEAAYKLLYFEKTPCYGRCPTYKLTLYSDKRMEYEGIRFVDSVGKFELTLNDQSFSKFNAIKNSYDWSQLAPIYESKVTDLPGTNMGIAINPNEWKETKVQGFPPEELGKIIERLQNWVSKEVEPQIAILKK